MKYGQESRGLDLVLTLWKRVRICKFPEGLRIIPPATHPPSQTRLRKGTRTSGPRKLNQSTSLRRGKELYQDKELVLGKLIHLFFFLLKRLQRNVLT